MNTQPRIGHFLYASCSAEDYGKIIAVGTDGNGTPTLDIEVFHPSDLAISDEDTDFPEPDLITVELPPGIHPILRNLQWRFLGEAKDDEETAIVCRTPGNGCFRCTKLFWLRDETAEPFEESP